MAGQANQANPPAADGGGGTMDNVNNAAPESRRGGTTRGAAIHVTNTNLSATPNGIADNAVDTEQSASNVGLQPWFWATERSNYPQQEAPSRTHDLSAPTSSAIPAVDFSSQGTTTSALRNQNTTRTLALELQTPTSGIHSGLPHNNTTTDARQGRRSHLHLPRLQFPSFFPDAISLESIELDNMDDPESSQPVQAQASNFFRDVGGFIRGLFYAMAYPFWAIFGLIRIGLAWFFYPLRVAGAYILYPFRMAWAWFSGGLGWLWSEDLVSWYLLVIWIGLFINLVIAIRSLQAINSSTATFDNDKYIDAVAWFGASLTMLFAVGCYYNYRQAGIEEFGAARRHRHMSRGDREFLDLTNRPARRRGYPPPPPQPHRRLQVPAPIHPADGRKSPVVYRAVSKSRGRVKHLKIHNGKKTTDDIANSATGESSRTILPFFPARE
ncbi:hypothetical protein F5Y04DRAFT_284969 [Hypomontagnella monticulosa]|nr:hypothetical protein F5Y04DRAFT_284969 [Hypomontagnella monticulosa]